MARASPRWRCGSGSSLGERRCCACPTGASVQTRTRSGTGRTASFSSFAREPRIDGARWGGQGEAGLEKAHINGTANCTRIQV